MAIGDFRLDSSGNFLLDASGNIYVEESCPDMRPASLLVTISGASLVVGCIANPAGVTSIGCSVQWEAGTVAPNMTFIVPGPLFPTGSGGGCCSWGVFLPIQGSYQFPPYATIPFPGPCWLDIYGPDVTPPCSLPNTTCIEFGPCSSGYLGPWASEAFVCTFTRAGSTWSMIMTTYYDTPAQPAGVTGQVTIFAGTATETNCMTPFSITNTATAVLTGGTAAITPQTC